MTLMVILGAGASYDSCPDAPVTRNPAIQFRPPLADGLFVSREEFRPSRQRFNEFHELIPLLLPLLGGKVEEALERLQAETAINPRRHQQLAAVRFYLQSIFNHIVPRWLSNVDHVTNHRALLDQIEHHRRSSGPVCLVTFNYDTLLEAALIRLGMTFETLADYVRHDAIKLFKLHGSHNWGRRLEGTVPAEIASEVDEYSRALAMIKHAATLNVSEQFEILEPRTYSGALYPAIALPVVKKSSFECPRDHVSQLATLIPGVTKIVMIGWRGTEDHFLSMLQSLQHGIDVAAVAGSPKDADETLGRIRSAGVVTRETAAYVGFSDTVAQRRLDHFLAA